MFAEIDQAAVRALPVALLTVGETAHQGFTERAAGFPDQHQLLWVTQGAGLFTYGDRQELLCAGDGIFLRRGTPHTYRPQGDVFATRWCTFTMPESLLSYLSVGEFLRFRVDASLEAETAALESFACADSTPLSRSAAVYTYVTEFFASVNQARISPAERAHRFLEQHYAEPLTLDDVAAAVGLGRYRLCHLYRQQRGASPMEDLAAIRVLKAKRLLALLDISVTEVAFMTGFDSPSYFAYCFRRAVGCSPSEYRHRKRQMPLSPAAW